MYSITVSKTLTLRFDVDGASDFDGAAEWVRANLGELDFGEGTPFFIEAADDGGREAAVAQGVEGA